MLQAIVFAILTSALGQLLADGVEFLCRLIRKLK